ncbi:hypothetical protein NM04_21630, partial [Massilia aurea]
MRLTKLAAAALFLTSGLQAHAGTFQQTATGIEVRPDTGAKVVRLNLMSDNIIQVVKLVQDNKTLTPSLMTVAAPCADKCAFTVTPTTDNVQLKAGKIAATVSLKDGQVQFFDAAGKRFLAQASESMQPVEVGG